MISMPGIFEARRLPGSLSGYGRDGNNCWVVTTIYGMAMTRTTVYLSLDAKRRLSAAAHRLHRSEADLIRDAIGRLLAEEPERPRPEPPRLDLDPSIADHVDEYLSAGFGAAGLEDTPWGG
jgi:hypothetical protein